MTASRRTYYVQPIGHVSLNDTENRRWHYLQESLHMTDEELVGWLVRAALTWFPSTWLRQLELVNELRAFPPTLDWDVHDELPF